MFLKSIDLTTALRPSYLPDEVLLFVQDNVGLYEGYATSAHDLRAKILL
jgi:ESCRT-II complex subunit VPS36